MTISFYIKIIEYYRKVLKEVFYIETDSLRICGEVNYY